MSLRIAVQMDPISTVDINGDTSFAFIEAAQARGHKVWTYQPKHLSWEMGRITARARPVTVQRVKEKPGIEGDPEVLDLAGDVDVILMRQDPPFDMSYITACHVLEFLKGTTLVLNDPQWVRSNPEKILPLEFPDLIPPTLISRDVEAIKAFRKQYKDIILKPLYGNGGAGVFRVKPDDGNFSSIVEMFAGINREPIVAQAFLPDVSAGDRRVILIEGEPVGVINRVPQPGETRSNMHVGGRAEAADLSAVDRHICEVIGPVLKERGLVFAGIDVIGDRLTEINVTSPTGVQELKRFSGVDAAVLFWDAVEARLAG
ncbi:glutathione synthase [Hyphobacterium sp. HN65]|uniref:Glutathione synthetase n=1 Tax=Hyphobacterium lacteum TaxID=3116575 RepID=A0ABU7LS03_9PROT|nr:glutathione synthase [Hyphobacterium sp. HN65]MEE2526672.1 glutathione synthase [Hyphobacterium sp. HN65]